MGPRCLGFELGIDMGWWKGMPMCIYDLASQEEDKDKLELMMASGLGP